MVICVWSAKGYVELVLFVIDNINNIGEEWLIVLMRGIVMYYVYERKKEKKIHFIQCTNA